MFASKKLSRVLKPSTRINWSGLSRKTQSLASYCLFAATAENQLLTLIETSIMGKKKRTNYFNYETWRQNIPVMHWDFFGTAKKCRNVKNRFCFFTFLLFRSKSWESCQLSKSRDPFFRSYKNFLFFFNFRNFSDSGFDKLEIQTTGEKKFEIEISLFFSLSIKHFMMFWFFSQWYVYFIYTLRLPRTGGGGRTLDILVFVHFFSQQHHNCATLPTVFSFKPIMSKQNN